MPITGAAAISPFSNFLMQVRKDTLEMRAETFAKVAYDPDLTREISTKRSEGIAEILPFGFVTEAPRLSALREKIQTQTTQQTSADLDSEIGGYAQDITAKQNYYLPEDPAQISDFLPPQLSLSSDAYASLFAADADSIVTDYIYGFGRFSGISPHDIELPAAYYDAATPYDDDLLVASLYANNEYRTDGIIPYQKLVA